MKKFIFNLLYFSLFIFACLFVIVRNPHKLKNDFIEAIVDKHDRLNNLQTPRLIIAGGSNVIFGIDSKLIQDSLGINTVNLGLHAGLGLDFILNELAYVAKPCDIIIFSPEYTSGTEGYYELRIQTAKIYPVAFNFFERDLFKKIKSFLFEQLQLRLKDKIDSLFKERSGNKKSKPINFYSRRMFDKYGDIKLHPGYKAYKNLGGNISSPKINMRMAKIIDDKIKKTDFEKVRFFYSFPSLALSQYKQAEVRYKRFSNILHNNLNAEIIGTQKEYIYPDSLFLDTVYHLNWHGRRKRTLQIISYLKKIGISKECF
ncbi:MAG: hypothetical protein RH860_05225 [Cytophagales bacterium]